MGILVSDSKTFNTGLILTNFVISIKGSLRGLEKINVYDDDGNKSVIYRVFYTIYYYTNEESYNNGAIPLDSVSETIDLTESQISTNIFENIYQRISIRYNNITNLL